MAGARIFKKNEVVIQFYSLLINSVAWYDSKQTGIVLRNMEPSWRMTAT